MSPFDTLYLVSVAHTISNSALGWKPSDRAVLADSLLAYFPRVFQNALLSVPTTAFKTLLHFRTISEKWSVDLLRTNMKMQEASRGQEQDSYTGLMASIQGVCIHFYADFHKNVFILTIPPSEYERLREGARQTEIRRDRPSDRHNAGFGSGYDCQSCHLWMASGTNSSFDI